MPIEIQTRIEVKAQDCLLRTFDRLSTAQRKSPENLKILGALCLVGRGDLNPNFFSALSCKARHYWACRPVSLALYCVGPQ